MFGQIGERRMHWVRWLITTGWLVLIVSLLYDPISPWLTQPDNQFSPLRIDPNVCVKVQGVCLKEQPYAIGAMIFWGAIVPSSIEVYVLAKVLPGFTQEKRHQAYKGVLREALEEGYVSTSSSLEVLQQMRSELNISEDEHRQVLEELGVGGNSIVDVRWF
jgi:hypothetical protein